MEAFFEHAQELLNQGYVQLLLGLYIVAQVWWWVRVAITRRNPTYTDTFNGTYAIIIAVDRPHPSRFAAALKSVVAHSHPSEIIVVIDDAPRAPKRIKSIAGQYATKVIELAQRSGPREQYAAAAEALKKRPDIIITTAPEATWNDTTTDVLRPFADDNVGAVSGRLTHTDVTTLPARLAQWFTMHHFTLSLPFQSYFGQAQPLTPQLHAVRRGVFLKSVLAVRNETFLGRCMLTAENESYTAHILLRGYRSVYQQAASVTVTAPQTFAAVIHRQLHGYRGALRSLIRHTALLRRLNSLVTLHRLTTLFSPLLYASIGVIAAFMIGYRIYEFNTSATTSTIVGMVGLALLVYVALSYLRHLTHLERPIDYALLPFYIIVGGVLILSTKFVALFTFAENTHEARTYSSYGEGKVGRSRTGAVLTAITLFAVALPLVYAAFVQPQGVPFTAILGQQGRAYAAAQALHGRLHDTQASNDPTAQELLHFLRTNAPHYNQSINEGIAESSLECVRTVLKTTSGNDILDGAQKCYSDTLVVAETKKNQPAPAPSPIVHIATKPGDTLTYLVRAEVKKLDTKNELSAAQAVYIETTYLAQTQQLDHYIDVNEDVTVDTDALKALVGNAKGLTAEQTAAWSYYASDIVW